MSRSVDERVVEMQFNNRDFEKNAQTSLSTLDKLKQSLNLLGTGDALKNIGDVDPSGINRFGDSVENVKNKFSALETLAAGALLKIGSQAVEAGEKLVKSLTIDQVTAGWDKYAEKTSAVQTIMAATRESWQSSADALGFEGTQMEFVNDQLDKLNWFTDETSYNFLDMVNNIGKFTNNGVALEKAVTSMEGISTWAALSGANVQEAGRAMYNLSQAMGVGAVTLADWKSIENANMATMEFKNVAMETAVELGQLTKVGEGLYKTLDGASVTAETFSKELTESKWFSKDVLVNTLDQFGAFTDVLNESQMAMEDHYDTTSELLDDIDAYVEGNLNLADIVRETGLSTEEVTQIFDKLSDKTYELGRRAFKAAQEAKTFQEAIDSVKDAASTKFMNMFETIFGNYEQAKDLWTAVANELYDAFVGPLDAMEELIADWADWGGNLFFLESIGNIWTALKNILSAVGDAWDSVFPPTSGQKLAEMTRGFRDFTAALIPSEKTMEVITAVFKVFFTVIKAGIDAIKGIASVITNVVTSIVKWVQGNESIQRFVTNLVAVIEKLHRWIGLLRVTLSNVFQTIQKNPAFKLLTVSINQLLAPLKKLVGNGSGLLDKASDAMERFLGMKFGEVFDQTKIQEFIEGFIVKKLIPAIGEATSVLSSFKEKLIGVFGSFGAGDLNFDTFKEFFGKIKESLKAAIDDVISFLQGDGDGLTGLKEKAIKIFTTIGEGFKSGLSSIDWGAILNIAKVGSIAWIVYNIGKTISNLKNITSGIGEFKDKLLDVFDGVCGVLKGYQNNLNATALLKVAAAIGILAISLVALTFVDSEKLATAAVSLAIVGGVLVGLVKVIGALSNTQKQTDAASTALSSFSSAIKDFTTRVGKKVAFAAVVVALAVAVGVLVAVVEVLGHTQWETAAKGCIFLGIIMAELTAAIWALNKIQGNISMKTAATLLALGLALNMLMVPVIALGALGSWSGVMQAGAILIGLGIAVAAISKAGVNSLKGSAALVVLALAINMLVPSLLLVGAHAEAAGKGLLILGIALAGLVLGGAIADKLAAGFAVLSVTMLSLGGTVLMVGAGMALAGASFLLASMGVEKLAQNLGPLAESFVEFVNTLNANNDAILQFVRNLFSNLSVAFDEFIPQIATLVAKLMIAVVQAIVDHSEELLGGILRLLIDVLTFLEEQFVPLTDRIVNLIGLLVLDVADAIVNATEVFGNAIKYVTDALILVLVEGIEGILTSILGAIPGIGPAASAAIHEQGLEVTSGIRADMDAIRGEMEAKAKEVGESIPDTMSAAISEGQPKVADATKSLSNIPEEPIKVSRSKYKESGENIPGGLAEGISANSFKVSTATNSLKDTMVSDLQSMSTNFNPVGEQWMTSLTEGMNVGMANMDTGFLTDFQGLMDTKFSAMTPNMNTYGQEWFGEAGILGGATTGMDNVDLATTDFLDSEQLKFEDYIPDFMDVGERSMGTTEGYGAGLQNKLDEVIQAGTDNKDGVVTELESGISEATTAGEDSALGYASGVRSKIDEAVNAARSLASAAWAAAKAEIQVSSPSKKFAWLGEQSDAGFAQGLIESTYLVEDASVGMARSAVNAMGEALAEANSYITDTMDVSPTITPVMDLSNIQDGVSSINDMVGSRLVTSGVGLSASYSPNSKLLSAINALSSPSNTANINVYVTGGPNANADEIAEEVINRINIEYQRQRAVWA